MHPFQCRPPRRTGRVILALLLLGCTSSSVYRANQLKARIQENLFSTEHLAFGADPRSVSAVRSLTTEEDLPTLISLLSDTSHVVVRVSQYVIISYGEKAVPHLENHAENKAGNGIINETLEMIRKRNTGN